ncbi:hypothetical protein HPG69_005158, partial [Diceros bicornis minor]
LLTTSLLASSFGTLVRLCLQWLGAQKNLSDLPVMTRTRTSLLLLMGKLGNLMKEEKGIGVQGRSKAEGGLSLGVQKTRRGWDTGPGEESRGLGAREIEQEEDPSPKLLFSLFSPALASSLCFNLDTDQPTTFHMDSAGFGHSVVQYADSRVVVGAPQEIKAANQTGGLYQCDYSTGRCEAIRLQVPPEAVNMSLGLSLAAATNPSQLLACGPTVHHACRENVYLTGFCFLMASPSWQAQRLPAALQECPKQDHDIVFLIDGSGSINSRDFTKMLNFVRAIMSQFQRPSTQFSLMQFASKFWVHFTFKLFMHSSDPLGLLKSVQQQGGLTHTASAIREVTNKLFSAQSGARKDASKVLIVITDGQKQGDPLGYEAVIPMAEAAGIIRYAVGVGSAFQGLQSWKELNDIASKPSREHIFTVENFDALRDVQNQLKEKIFAVEGTQTLSSSSFELEMAQEGFSAVFTPLTDVAIGAPGEQENQGAVYLFHGISGPGISPSHSQRITGSQLSPRLQYFGQSLSGGQDLTLDGLVDLAVGAQGHVLLLRTRPVLRVWTNIRITPAEIARSVFECQEQMASGRELGVANVCLRIYETPKNRLGDLKSSVTFDLTLDPGRLSPRAIFEETKTWNLTRVRVLGLKQHCEAVKLLLPACVEDSVTPIILRLNFSLVGEPIPSFGSIRPILAVDAQRYFTASLPFEKNCGADHVCQDDLGISFGFSGLKTLIVGNNLELNMEVTVRNDGEDSYGTAVTFFYPPGLSYRRVAGVQSQLQPHSPRLTCDSPPSRGQGTQSTRCSINYLVFRQGAQITFMVTFDVSSKAMLGDRLLLTANVSSDNNTPRTSKTTFQLELPVKYAVYTVISRCQTTTSKAHEQSTKYLNFSASEEKESSRVNNLGQRDLPVSINFLVPVELNRVPVWTEVEVSHPQNPSIQCPWEKIVPTESDFLTHIQKNLVLNCSIAGCLRFRCDIPSFGIQEELDFILKGNLSFGWVKQVCRSIQSLPWIQVTLQKKLLVVSVAEITFDRSMGMMLEKYEVHNPIPLIVGSSVGGLLLLALITAVLYKVGFFKRQYKEIMEEANGQTVPENGTSDPQVAQ